jgi:hypothetical protein
MGERDHGRLLVSLYAALPLIADILLTIREHPLSPISGHSASVRGWPQTQSPTLSRPWMPSNSRCSFIYVPAIKRLQRHVASQRRGGP